MTNLNIIKSRIDNVSQVKVVLTNSYAHNQSSDNAIDIGIIMLLLRCFLSALVTTTVVAFRFVKALEMMPSFLIFLARNRRRRS